MVGVGVHRASVIIAVLCASAISGCSVDRLVVEGRTCGTNHPCPEGFVCDPATGTCRSSAAKDGTVADLDGGSTDDADGPKAPDRGKADGIKDRGPRPDRPATDLRRPDLKRPDSKPPIDAGCPAGKVFCAGKCVDVSKNPDHCGTCNNRCSGATDRCIAKKCVCGLTNSGCSSGLNCVKGSCRCLNGGLCTGCCDGTSRCVALSATTASKCGKAGNGCRPCTGGGQCATATCSTGLCTTVNKANGTTCNDGKSCTFSDKCSSGTCKGQAFTCNDGKSCTTDICLGKPPPNSCSFALKSNYCLIGGTCYISGTKNPADSCQQCTPTSSIVRWTTVPGCTGSATVSTLFASPNVRLPRGLYMPNSGTLYITDTSRHTIQKATRVGTSWTISVLAGAGSSGFADGTGTSAKFYYPEGLEMDASGNLYVTDSWNNAIRKVTSSGRVTTIAGTTASGYVNGTGSAARFNYPAGITRIGSNLYVADQRNHVIRQISNLSTTPRVTTYAGSTQGFADGALTSAKFSYPYGLESTSSGILYVGDSSNHRIRQITSTVVTTIAGTGTRGSTDGAASSATFDYIKHIRLSPSGALYIADYENHKVRKLYGGQVTTVAGSGTNGYLDGAALSAQFRYPYDIAFDTVGYKIYVADYNSSKLRVINLSSAP